MSNYYGASAAELHNKQRKKVYRATKASKYSVTWKRFCYEEEQLLLRPTAMGPPKYEKNETPKNIISAAIISVFSSFYVPR